MRNFRRFLIILFSLCYSYSFSQSYVPELNNPKIKVQPEISIKAYAFNVKDVQLLEGSAFKHAMELDEAYLLEIDPDRLLHRFHANAGLPVKGEVYGGWESEGLSGHTLGHYLSACALTYANTGKVEFKKKVDYIVDELERCQIARKSGYVGAIPKEDSIFAKVERGEIKSGGFDLNGGWSPWYTVHKVMAGLVDAYLYCDNEKALKVVIGMADWTEKTVGHLSEELRLKMLNCEYGGMQDVLSVIYSITADKKYLNLSYKFDDKFIMGELADGNNPLTGKHSNTNVPKAVGAARRFELTNVASDRKIALNFWDQLALHHAYVIGGNSNYEYLGEPDKLNDRLSDNTCETCNSYNMLKLTRHLFAWEPNRKLLDFYERTLYNHILSSQNPEDGMMCYFTPLRMGTHKHFSDKFNTFTCCVGSGIENHSKYVEAIYNETADGNLFVNLFIPSRLNWISRNAIVTLETAFPSEDKVKLTLELQKTAEFTLFVRKPSWVKESTVITVNGKKVETKIDANGYLEIKRKWKNSDKLEFNMPMSLRTEAMPDNPGRIAFLYGPIVLAAQLGDKMPDPVYGTPVLLTDGTKLAEWLKPVEGQSLTFKTMGVGQPFDVTLTPFYSTYKTYYSVYFDYFTKEAWDSRKAEYEAEKKRQQEIEEKTIDNFRIGEMQPERDHNLKASEKSYVDQAFGRSGREARGGNYFAFEMKVLPEMTNKLLLTYIGDDKKRKFDILIDGQKLTTVEWNGGVTGKFYDEEYPLPGALLMGKAKITVRIEANYEKTAGRIFGCRIIKE